MAQQKKKIKNKATKAKRFVDYRYGSGEKYEVIKAKMFPANR